jgi:hypothetical protein
MKMSAHLEAGEGNVLDATEWERFLKATERRLDDMLAKESN